MFSQSPAPSTSTTLQTLYTNLLRPILLPPPNEHTQPLLDTFVSSHDPLLESTTLFTAAPRLRETGVEVEAIIRGLRRSQTSREQHGDGGDVKALVESVKRGRLRSRLLSQAQPNPKSRALEQDQEGKEDGEGEAWSKEEIMRRSRLRMEEFEERIRGEEERALEGFKEGLRRAVGAV